MSTDHAAFKLVFNLSYLANLWKNATLCLMVMQPSNLPASLHFSQSFTISRFRLGRDIVGVTILENRSIGLGKGCHYIRD